MNSLWEEDEISQRRIKCLKQLKWRKRRRREMERCWEKNSTAWDMFYFIRNRVVFEEKLRKLRKFWRAVEEVREILDDDERPADDEGQNKIFWL